MKIIHTWNNFESVFVRYLDENGNKKISELETVWYFGIWKKDEDKVKGLLEGVKYIHNPKFPEYVQVFIPSVKNSVEVRNNIILRLEQNEIETFEGDLLSDKRWFVDNNVEISDNLTKLYFDIETDDSNEKIEIGRDRIVSFSGIGSDGKQYFEMIEKFDDESEKKLLKQFLKLLPRYDLILGWNSSQFDVPYLKARMKLYGLHKTNLYRWKEVGHYDLLKRFRHIFRFDSYIKKFSLDYITKHFLGKGKVERTERIIDLWKTNKDKLKKYNIEDTVILKELDEKLGVSQMMIRQSQWCKVPPSQFGLYSIIDSFILQTAHQNGKMGRTSIKAIKERSIKNERGNVNPDETTTEGAKYSGAIVLEPKIGKYEKVYTFDFKGLYPSLIKTSNIGYDSIHKIKQKGDIINPGTLFFPRKSGKIEPTYFSRIPSVINLAITQLIELRNEYKKLKLKMIEEGTNKGPDWLRVVSDEIIVKELANSTYGIMGLDYGRYYSVDIAESITLFGQWAISFAKKFFEDRGFNVIYGDTDSIFVSTGKEILDIENERKLFHQSLEKELKEQFNIDRSFIQLNFDKEYDSLILLAKKTYVGHVINIEGKKTDDIYARGLDFLKKNTFGFASEKQKELVNIILRQEKDFSQIMNWAHQIRSEFYNKDFSKEELTLTQKIGKSSNEYKKTPPIHARLAKEKELKTGKIYVNTEIEFIVTSQKPILNGVLLENYKGQFDRDYYWENKTLPLIERITGVVFPGSELFSTQKSLF